MTSFAQEEEKAGLSRADKSQAFLSAEHKLFEIARAKNQNGAFTLITPQDLGALSPDEQNALSSPQGPCDTYTSIGFGQTLGGQLTSSDCAFEDGSYADFYGFNGTAGQQVTVAMNSSAFDTYLGLANEDDSLHVEDDDGGGGTNSRIVATLPSSGLYIILANSAFPAQFGSYSVSLTVSASCTYSLSPTSANVPAAGGTFTLQLLTQAGCQWESTQFAGFPHVRLLTTSGTGPQTLTYTVEANPFEVPRNGAIFIVANQTFTVNQAAKVCTYSMSLGSASHSAAAATGSFTITTDSGCSWRPDSSNLFISYNNGGGVSGSGTVTYTLTTNNGAARTGTITAAGQTFTISQAGLNCTFTLSQSAFRFDRFARSGTIAVNTQPGCSWRASGLNWVTANPPETFGSGSFTYQLAANTTGAPRTQLIGVFGSSLQVSFSQSATSFVSRPDFDANGKADFAVFRGLAGNWFIPDTSGGFNVITLGSAADKLAPADFDGDGKTDAAVYNGGNWTIRRSSDGQFINVSFGAADDIPVPADFDGDGKADISVYRPSNGVWYRLDSSTGAFVANGWGASEDKPAAGDFDGDGKADLCVYRPSNGVWYLLKSSNNVFVATGFGAAEDLVVPGDYDGDGKTDVAVYRPSNGVWYRLNSSDNSFAAVGWGIGADKPVPADYDGDGKTDIAVYRNGSWFVVRSTDGQIDFGYFGNETDIPLANAYVR